MTNNKNRPNWPFLAEKNSSKGATSAFELNQSLSVALDDDSLRNELIDMFSQRVKSRVQAFPSAFHPDDEYRSRAYSHLPPAGHRNNTWLVAGYKETVEVLTKPEVFSNVPYAELGDRSFLLAIDPYHTTDQTNKDESARAEGTYLRQFNYLNQLSQSPCDQQLSKLANEAVRHAVIAGLTRDRFDLAAFAEQAAVRFIGLWFGFASTDHGLIQKTAGASYRALVYQILGKHLTSEPTTVPQARATMAHLTERISMLIAEYRKVAWKPRTVHGKLRHRENRAEWPDGVIPLDEWGLSSGGFPILKQMALKPEDFTIAELASMATGMIAGTVGNVQASTCIAMNQIFANVDCLEEVIAEANICVDTVQKGNLHHRVGKLLINEPPVAFLPRRALEKVQLGDKLIEAGDDVILWLTAASKIKQLQYKKEFYGLSFGAVDTRISDTSKVVATPHACLGKTVAHTLITAIVGAVLRLPSVAEVIDPVTGKPEGLERRWGFSCESYPLTYKRSLRIAQQPLNVIMRVKTPIDHHSTAVQNIIHVGAPRVVQVLKESAHVHFAWFQLMDQGRYLALHTVYDGNFEAYIQDFALKVDDLFDLLFEHVEGAPPLPVAENPGAFTNVIRAHNAPAVNGFFFSAAPTAEVSAIIAKANGS